MSNRFSLKVIYLSICFFSICMVQWSCSSSMQVELEELNCRKAIRMLKAATDPEFGKLIRSQAIPIESEKHSGCALVFTRVQEEMSGEVIGDSLGEVSQEIAIGLTDSDQRMELQELPAIGMRKGVIKIEIELQEIWGNDDIKELVITERSSKAADQYQGLRIFSFVPGVPYAREILSTPLYIKTSEGISLLGKWKVDQFEGQTVIVITAGKHEQLYSWHDGSQSFKLDLAATERKKISATPSKKK
jgi:hypothetical protein